MAARPRLRVAGVGEVELAGASVAGVARECERGAVRRQQWSDLRAGGVDRGIQPHPGRSEEHTSELQSLMRISYAAFCLKKKHQPTKLSRQVYSYPSTT